MKLLITGANGFLGRQVVRAALAHGHGVRAMVRPTTPEAALRAEVDGEAGARLEIVRHDLRRRDGLAAKVRGTEAVLHLAAAKSGSYYAQMAGTVVATENLLAAMREAEVDRLVLTSSFAVYDHLAIRIGGVLDEASPLEREPERRDDYCRTKLWQERLVREAMGRGEVRATVLRPGVVYAEPDQLWTDRLGVRAGRTWVAIGSRARLPLTHVRHCAEAVVLAAEQEAAAGQTLNLVDDDPPTQRQYRRALQAALRPRVVPVNWTLMRAAAALVDAIDRRLLAGQAKLPAILRRRALHARCRPLRYTNRRACEVLGWSAPARWREAIEAVGRSTTVASSSRENGRDARPTATAGRGTFPDPRTPAETPCASRT